MYIHMCVCVLYTRYYIKTKDTILASRTSPRQFDERFRWNVLVLGLPRMERLGSRADSWRSIERRAGQRPNFIRLDIHCSYAVVMCVP